MTKREFYTAIVNANVSDEVTAFAQELITKLDETNAKRAAKVAEKKSANSAIYEAIVGLLTKTPMTSAQLVELAAANEILNPKGEAFSKQGIASALKGYVASGVVVKSTVKQDKKNITVYSIAE